MALSGGGDRRLLRPVEHNEGVRGSHRGDSEALNVKNAQPGFHYRYDPERRLRKRINEGYEIVTDGPESWGADLPAGVAKQLDNIRAFKDVILLRIPIEKYREKRKKLREKATLAREGVEASYLDKGEAIRDQVGATEDVYYRRGNHRTYRE